MKTRIRANRGSIARPVILIRLLLAIGVLLASLVGATSWAENGLPMARPEKVGMDSERLKRLDDVMQGYIDDELLAGTVTLIARQGKVVHFSAQGWRDREAGEKMKGDEIFTIMSMTKPIVTVALMMLFEEGHFLLDDPISDWIPEYKEMEVLAAGPGGSTGRVPAVRPLTIRHVLTHTSGLSTRPRGRGMTQREMATFEGGRPETVEEMITRAAVIPLSFQPGENWQYGSSTDYVALLVERISGESLDDFLRERILHPLGMRDTHYNIPRDKVGRVAAAYKPTGEGNTIELHRAPAFREPTRFFPGTYGLNSTAADYFKFSQMLLNGGELNGVRLLSPKTIDLMITNQVGDMSVYIRGPGYGFGLGFGILTDPAKAREPLTPGSFTWGGAWGTIFWIDPAEELIGIMMTQITSYRHLTVRNKIAVMATQAVTKSLRHEGQAIGAYRPLN